MESINNESYVSDFTKKSDSLDLYEEAMMQFSSTRTIGENNTALYSDDFGGVYIDEYGVLNIGVVSESRTGFKSLESLSNFDGQVIYKPYTYSYNYLVEIKEAAKSVMSFYNIYKVIVKESHNKVIVSLSNEKSVNGIISYLKNMDLYSADAIDFTVDPFDNVEKTSATVYPGDEVAFHSDNTYHVGTIGATVRCNRTGAYGIITNGHVAPAGVPMIYNWETLGVRDRGQISGTIDAAFVPFADQNNWQTTSTARFPSDSPSEYYENTHLGSETHIIEGQLIKRIGYATGVTTGNITSRNASVSIRVDGANVTIDKTIEYDNTPQQGDSGGPVYYDDGSGNLYLLGLNFSSSSNRGYACRISETMKILDVSPITKDPLPLGMEVVTKYGGWIPDWDIRLTNPNNFPVAVIYNGRMCNEDDARYFRNLNQADEKYEEIAANSSKVVRINGNGTAGWITAAISFSLSDSNTSGFSMMISYTNGLNESGLNSPQVNPIIMPFLHLMSAPEYLGMEVINRYGWFMWQFDWDIKLSNYNDIAVAATYNQRMCNEGDARNFTNLTEQVSISIPANGSVIVRINCNGTAGWISAAINYSILETTYINNKPYKIMRNKKRISYANELNINPFRLTRYTNQINA